MILVCITSSDFNPLVILLGGGEINAQYGFTGGNDAIEQLGRYRAKYAFLSVDGVCPDSGITTLHAEEVMIDRMMIERSGEAVIIADSGKLGREGFLNVCALNRIGCLVTEKGADTGFIKTLKEREIKVLLG